MDEFLIKKEWFINSNKEAIEDVYKWIPKDVIINF
jgi:hypothetical protein